MAEGQAEDRVCDLRLALFRYGGVRSSYDPVVGLMRRVVIVGRIDDPDLGPGSGPSFSDSRFHGKPVRLEISSPPDPEWLDEIRKTRGVAHACGLVRINAGVESERITLDGGAVEDEPLVAMVVVSADAFEVIRRQAAEAYDHRRVMWANVKLAGDPLPNSDKSLGYICLKDLDVSERRGYAVRSFEIFDTRYIDHLRGRVLPFERGRREGYGVSVSILLTEVRYHMNIERAYVHSISCEGRAISCRGKPYDGADATIEFGEHEPNSATDQFPEKAFFGEIGYWPKRLNDDSSSPHFWFRLMHVPEDARGLLIPLLSHEAETRVILTINLTNEEEELLTATDVLRGKVRYYSFEVQRRLTNDSS